ncbi:MAG: methylated-DNA--[protein]-cysteine S-methyltransferase [Saprospiraceae bacterium]|nr:methylated-DNA--[protein]-cysteine S-methyltransferase [Saprospiraceae bacterium]
MLETAYLDTPIGCLEIKGSRLGIQSIQRIDNAPPESAAPSLTVMKDSMMQLQAYFEGKCQSFDLLLDWSEATDFYKSVWQQMLQIPYGRTTTYSEIAHQLNRPKAVRAVGMASKHNPIAIVVPCHRVIAKSGALQGYFYGLEVKAQLLALEYSKLPNSQGRLF